MNTNIFGHTIRHFVGRPSIGFVILLGFLALNVECWMFSASAQTTQVLLPINTLFGGAAYNRPITISAANTLITDGQNLWAGTYTIVPASTTNPIVSLYPNSYLMKVAGVVKPARFTVPTSTNVLDVTTLLTSGPLFYFGGSGLANLLAGTNVVFVTNSDGSITINWAGSGLPQIITNASYATNAGTALYANIAGLAQFYLGSIGVAQITNLPPYLTNFSSGITLFGTFNGVHAGDGSGLTNLQSGNLLGPIPWNNLPSGIITNFAGNVTLAGTFSGNGSGLTNLNARALIISNSVAIYPHLSGTNAFWSTQP